MVKIEVGKCYKTVDGRKVGPLLNDNWNGGTFITRCEFAGGLWKENGEAVIRGAVDSPTLVSEWVEEMKFEVGDLVTKEGWGIFYEVVEVGDETLKLLNRNGTKYSYDIDTGLGLKWIKKEKPSNSPIREVTKKELVPGVYGNLTITDDPEGGILYAIDENNYNAQELRDMAKTLIEVADYLEGE